VDSIIGINGARQHRVFVRNPPVNHTPVTPPVDRCCEEPRDAWDEIDLRILPTAIVRRRGPARVTTVSENFENISMASMLIAKLQECISTEVIRQDELSVSVIREQKRGAILLIRPAEPGGLQQICVMFGEKKWRTRRSMSLATVRITRVIGETAPLVSSCMSCTCAQYRSDESCGHTEAIKNDAENVLHYSSVFLEHHNDTDREVSDGNNWCAVYLPLLANDNVEVWQAFRKRALSSTFRTSATALFDIRARCLDRRPEIRVQCMLCLGAASNRTSCNVSLRA